VPPLAGTTVADLTRYLPGPFASRELLRLGARVVKIEPPEGDPSRTASPAWYRALNDGKEVLTWDARREPPPQALVESDVVLEGFRPGVWERLCVELPESTMIRSYRAYTSTNRAIVECPSRANPAFAAGCPQHAAPSGTSTLMPSRSSTVSAAIATCGKNWST